MGGRRGHTVVLFGGVKMGFIAGLDLGQRRDYSAFCALFKTVREGKSHYLLGHLERFQFGTSYPAIVERLRLLFAPKPGKPVPSLAGSPLAVDGTGVGRAVVDMVR